MPVPESGSKRVLTPKSVEIPTHSHSPIPRRTWPSPTGLPGSRQQWQCWSFAHLAQGLCHIPPAWRARCCNISSQAHLCNTTTLDWKYWITLNWKKCQVCDFVTHFLGHIIEDGHPTLSPGEFLWLGITIQNDVSKYPSNYVYSMQYNHPRYSRKSPLNWLFLRQASVALPRYPSPCWRSRCQDVSAVKADHAAAGRPNPIAKCSWAQQVLRCSLGQSHGVTGRGWNMLKHVETFDRLPPYVSFCLERLPQNQVYTVYRTSYDSWIGQVKDWLSKGIVCIESSELSDVFGPGMSHRELWVFGCFLSRNVPSFPSRLAAKDICITVGISFQSLQHTQSSLPWSASTTGTSTDRGVPNSGVVGHLPMQRPKQSQRILPFGLPSQAADDLHSFPRWHVAPHLYLGSLDPLRASAAAWGSIVFEMGSHQTREATWRRWRTYSITHQHQALEKHSIPGRPDIPPFIWKSLGDLGSNEKWWLNTATIMLPDLSLSLAYFHKQISH